MIIAIGEILLDVFPDYRRIGGAPFNFAYHLNRFGLPVRFVSRVGMDEEGMYIRKWLKKQHFNDDFIQTDDTYPTGRVNVIMKDDGSHRFEIQPDSAYDHIMLTDILPDAPPKDKNHQYNRIDMIYFGTLAQRTRDGYMRIREFLARRPSSTMTFCDLNLRPVHYPDGVITTSLEQADILKLNDQEFDYVRDLLKQQRLGTDAFSAWLMEAFGIEWICLTMGEQGSRIYTRQEMYETSGVKPLHVVDTVGAGDAYSAVLALGRIGRWPVGKILSAASRFAADICGISGAIPLESGFYRSIHNEISDSNSGNYP